MSLFTGLTTGPGSAVTVADDAATSAGIVTTGDS